MIKLVFTLKRRPDISPEEFQTYWRERHAPLVKQRADVLRIRRYVQTHAVVVRQADAVSAPRSSPPNYFDGVAELWWDSLEDLELAGSTEEGLRAARELLRDEANFIDLPNSPLWFGVEHVVISSEAD